jgi:hypothetical protein
LIADATGRWDALERVRAELVHAEHILSSEYSFDLAEPNYVRALSAIRNEPGQQQEFERLLLQLFRTKAISEEPLAYLMHQLRWEGVRRQLKADRRSMPHQIATGRPIDRVLEAYDDDWENREFYKHL